MSGSGAGAIVRIFVLSEWRAESGKPERWLVAITGESLFSSATSATNSSAISAKPAVARKARAGIAVLRPYARLEQLGPSDGSGRVGPWAYGAEESVRPGRRRKGQKRLKPWLLPQASGEERYLVAGGSLVREGGSRSAPRSARCCKPSKAQVKPEPASSAAIADEAVGRPEERMRVAE